MSIQRYTLGMGREDLADEDEPCLFQDDNGEAVTYDDHIAEVQRLSDDYAIANELIAEKQAIIERLVESEGRAAAEVERLRSIFSVRTWTIEMHNAWHRAIPDVSLAFKELVKAAEVGEEKT